MNKLNIPIVITKDELAIRVCTIVNHDGCKYIDAIIDVCEEIGIDANTIVPLITGPLRAKLEIEAMNNNILPNTCGAELVFD